MKAIVQSLQFTVESLRIDYEGCWERALRSFGTGRNTGLGFAAGHGDSCYSASGAEVEPAVSGWPFGRI